MQYYVGFYIVEIVRQGKVEAVSRSPERQGEQCLLTLRVQCAATVQILLWPYPDTDRLPMCIDSSDHTGNIFGISFLPFSNNTQLVTGVCVYVCVGWGWEKGGAWAGWPGA